MLTEQRPAPSGRRTPARPVPLGPTADPAPGERRRATPARLALAALAALAALWAVASLWWPIGFDHGLYAWVGDVIVRGGLQYRDAWDMHGPLAGYLFAIPALLVGGEAWGIRVMDLAILAAGAAAVHRLVRVAAGVAAARWAVVVLVLAYASLSFNETAQPDGWVGLLGIAALVPLLTRASRPMWTVALAGLAVGAFAIIKPFYAAYGAVPLACLLLDRRGADARALLRAVLVLVAGAMIPVVAFAGWFASQGALDDLLEVHLLYTTRTYSGIDSLQVGARVQGVVQFLLAGKIVPVALAAIAVGLHALWADGRRGLAAAAGSWVAVTVACVALQNKWYYYHWAPLLPWLAMLGTVGLARAHAAAGGAGARLLVTATAAVVLTHAALRPAAYVAQWAAYAVGRTTYDAYYGAFETGPIRPLHQMQAARYLREHVPTADGGVAIWGTDAGLLYLADQPTPFRLAGWVWPMVEGYGTPVREEYRAEYLRSLAGARPAYYVVNTAYAADTSYAALDRFPELAEYLDRHYRPDAEFGPLRLYRRRDLGATPAAP